MDKITCVILAFAVGFIVSDCIGYVECYNKKKGRD